MGANPSQNSNLPAEPLTDLYSLQEVYGIEFGLRGIWTCKVSGISVPEKYSKAMLAKSCQETSKSVQSKAIRAGDGLTFVPLPTLLPELTIDFYDDDKSTIEHWLRKWHASTRGPKGTVTYPTTYAATITCTHYNVQHTIIANRRYVVIPNDSISVTSDESITATVIHCSFKVYDIKEIK